ncbi:hypothetical protein [Geodermatophilus sp. DF01_2]|nr:hypothetical protein [Geodermatophilus sp. DF01_2]
MSLDLPFIPESAEAGVLADVPGNVAERVTEGGWSTPAGRRIS